MPDSRIDRRTFLKGVAAATAATILPRAFADQTAPRKPNIIFILCDDLGWGESGCYGQQKLQTPTIDRLASEGMRFTQFYAGNPICAPSRCSLLTGLHSGHAAIRDNAEVRPEGQRPLPTGTFTLGTLLQKAGYKTACIGKWGLGGPDSTGQPDRVGFDYFYGHLCQRVAHNHYADHVWQNRTRIDLAGNSIGNFHGAQYTPELMAQEAEKFIRDNAQNPFLLYFATPLPHVGLQAPDAAVQPFIGRWPDQAYNGKAYNPCEHPHATYAAMVSLIDQYTARILALLKELNLENDTMVCFGADHGPTFPVAGADSKFFHSANGFRGLKGDVYEGGIRVPFIVRWPGRVAPGTVSDQIGGWIDILPTIADALNLSAPPHLDGISILPTLLNSGSQSQHDYLYWNFPSFGGQVAVRMQQWKAVRTGVRKNRAAPIQLFNLSADLAEQTDVAAANPKIVDRIRQIMATAYTPSDYPDWNFVQ